MGVPEGPGLGFSCIFRRPSGLQGRSTAGRGIRPDDAGTRVAAAARGVVEGHGFCRAWVVPGPAPLVGSPRGHGCVEMLRDLS